MMAAVVAASCPAQDCTPPPTTINYRRYTHRSRRDHVRVPPRNSGRARVITDWKYARCSSIVRRRLHNTGLVVPRPPPPRKVGHRFSSRRIRSHAHIPTHPLTYPHTHTPTHIHTYVYIVTLTAH